MQVRVNPAPWFLLLPAFLFLGDMLVVMSVKICHSDLDMWEKWFERRNRFQMRVVKIIHSTHPCPSGYIFFLLILAAIGSSLLRNC